MFEHLCELLNNKEKLLLVLGGSSVTEHKSSTSDLDFFAIADSSCFESIKRSINYVKGADLEIRDLQWLEALSKELTRYKLSVNGSIPNFNFFDLRFLARVSLGRVLIQQENVYLIITSVREDLRLALASFISTFYINTYEDIVGLFIDERFEEILLIAGELAQRACLLAILQIELVDPSPKWSVAMIRESKYPRVTHRANQLLNHLGAYSQQSPRDWVIRLLKLANSTVATGIIASSAQFLEIQSYEKTACLNSKNHFKAPLFCLMGIPGYLTLVNILDGKISICNQAFIIKLAKEID